MLPRNIPKFGSFLVNAAPQCSGIELKIGVHEPSFGLQRNVAAVEDTLIRCLGRIIPFAGLVAKAFFGNQFQGGLKEVEVEPQVILNTFQESQFLLGFPAVIANGVPHNRPILLLHMRLIVFLVGARTRKSNLLVQAVTV